MTLTAALLRVPAVLALVYWHAAFDLQSWCGRTPDECVYTDNLVQRSINPIGRAVQRLRRGQVRATIQSCLLFKWNNGTERNITCLRGRGMLHDFPPTPTRTMRAKSQHTCSSSGKLDVQLVDHGVV